MPGRLTDKVAIITGATSGIGKATAILFAAEGARLVITGRRADLGNALAEQLGAPDRCLYVEADHTRLSDCQRVVDASLQQFGRLDILFNNAGIVTSGTAETTDEQTWDDTLAINVTAVWHMCKLVIPHMKRQGGGVIVNNGSDWSVVAGDDAFPYIASKGAIAMMTKSMAIDFASDHIRVNAVCPGDTFVERWLENSELRDLDTASREKALIDSASYLPMGRFGTPDEIARAVLFLACDDSSFVTGHLLLVDGGNTAH